MEENGINKQVEEEIFTNEETLYREVNVGRNLCEVRRDKGYSQEWVALQLGVSQQTVSRIEKNPKINPKYFEKIADIYGKSTDYILNYDLDRVIENTQYIYSGGKGYTDKATDQSTNTNSLDVIKFMLEENNKLHRETIKEKDETIRSLKAENKLLKNEIAELKKKISK